MMVLRTTSRRLGVLAAALALALAACGGDDDSEDAGSDNTGSGAAVATSTGDGGSADTAASSDDDASAVLSVAINGDPQSLDPAKNGGGPQQLVQWLAYEPLIRQLADGTAEPGLAESWEYVGDDNTVFQLTLREGVAFADGTPVTAQSVVDSINYFIATPSPAHSLIETVGSVEAVDDATVKVTFAQPNPNAVNLFSQVTNYGDIISPAGLANPDQLGTATFGAGPYVLDGNETVSGDRYTFVPNDAYWNPEAQHWGQVVVRIIGDPNTALNAVKTGQINVSTVTTPAQLGEAESEGLDMVTGGQLPIVVWIMDRNGETQPALGDVQVREALNLAIDRESIAAALGDAYSPLSQFAAPGSEAYVDDREAIPYDTDEATSLLAEAGYADGFQLALATNTDNRDDEVSQILVQQWNEIGVDTSLQTYDNQPTEMFGAIADKQHQAITFALNTTLQGYEAILMRESVFNPYGASDPEVEEAFNAWAVAPPDDVAAAGAEVATKINDLAWFVPVASVENFFVSQGVGNLGSMSSSGLYDVLAWTPAS